MSWSLRTGSDFLVDSSLNCSRLIRSTASISGLTASDSPGDSGAREEDSTGVPGEAAEAGGYAGVAGSEEGYGVEATGRCCCCGDTGTPVATASSEPIVPEALYALST